MNDARRQWEWANDIRPWVVDPEPIPWDAHLRWMESVIADPYRTLYIGDSDGPVGSIRFDVLDDGQTEVSIMIDPACRGQGYGRRLLDAGIAAHGPGVYLARVKPENDPSLGLFRHWTETAPQFDPPLRRFLHVVSSS